MYNYSIENQKLKLIFSIEDVGIILSADIYFSDHVLLIHLFLQQSNAHSVYLRNHY